jgi:hypothetical protein
MKHDIDLLEGLRLLAQAPPVTATEISRDMRLRLQAVLLAALPDWRPGTRFRIYWRRFFVWSREAVVGCGEVEWEGRRRAFAVDPTRATLHRGGRSTVSLVALHFALNVTDDTAA